MTATDIPAGVCRCATVKHALSPETQAATRELIRTAEAQGKTDLADCYRERLTHCHTANRKQAA